jgi:hypothetical protein
MGQAVKLTLIALAVRTICNQPVPAPMLWARADLAMPLTAADMRMEDESWFFPYAA